MAKLLIVYGTFEGHTEKIANIMVEELRRLGNTVDTLNTNKPGQEPGGFKLTAYDGVIAGAPVHYSGYPTRFRNWVKVHTAELSNRPGAFFSVCLGILQKNDEKAQNEVRQVVHDFFDWSDWTPQSWIILPGALAYSKYGIFTRFIMKTISRRTGRDTDTSRDYEYTDWDEVRRFARDFDLLVRRGARPREKTREAS